MGSNIPPAPANFTQIRLKFVLRISSDIDVEIQEVKPEQKDIVPHLVSIVNIPSVYLCPLLALE